MNSGSKVYIGTSGFAYDHWKGVFYPEKLPAPVRFHYYSRRMNSVEINSTFYRTPSPECFSKWHHSTPDNFSFVLKGSRFITHYHKLKVTTNYLTRFLNPTGNLKNKLAAVLWQLPPDLSPDIEILEKFLVNLSPFRNCSHFFEFRNPLWYNNEISSLLNKHNATRCCSDWQDLPFDLTQENQVKPQYIRLHGPSGAAYCDSYRQSFLETLAQKIIDNCNHKINTYIFFNNDIGGHAIKNAQTLMKILS
ncbi:MAG: DUF72 domain-containing protein [Lentisphaerae bacterium]|nr:DUF72 domain-containing protein [Lentisphaerota bacterium]MCP4100495.1 DUF72 domain-containing protein [Lentisphaerota bacterium]